jgi:hypothetical protein
MGRKNKAPVVIVRKDKRLNRTGHVLAFMLTGGTSSVYTASKAATNAGYNARTRRLQAQAEAADAIIAEAEFRAEHVPASAEYKARHQGHG